MRDVAVIGVGMTRFGELWEYSFRDMFVEAARAAIKDAGVDRIDSMYVGCMSGGLFIGQEHIGSLLADYLGVASIPATRVESACASSGVAFRQAFMEVASGMSDIVLAGGVEKMTDSADVTAALATAADQEYEVYNGLTFPGLFAMVANAYMARYGATHRQLAHVAVKNHENGSKNPKAHFQNRITLEQVEQSTLVADPLRVLDCCPSSDGAAAVIVCSLEMAKKLSRPAVKIIGSGQSTDTIALHQRQDLTSLSAIFRSSQAAYKMAGVKPKDIDLAEVHDCFTIAEIVISEDLGFFEKGKGAEAAENGLTALDGSIPINPGGGLKSKGHPVGATGIAQIVELYDQLTQRAGDRQVKNARRALSQNMGGSGGSSVVHILEVI